ncbi:MAG: hypothetical protein JXQ29_01895, partial [Planctomycetes bacterium]|nr:hypothetical protein [Planctomycetota bacterium]
MSEVTTSGSPGGAGAPAGAFTAAEMEKVSALNRALARAYGERNQARDRREAQRHYLDMKAWVSRRA